MCPNTTFRLTLTRGSVLIATAFLFLPAAGAASAQGAGAVTLTLQGTIERAGTGSAAAEQARETLFAAELRDRSFWGRLLPQISLSGTVPNVNRSIIPVTQPDGSTLFLPQRQTESSLALNLTQRLPITGGDLTISSDLTRIDRYGQTDSRLWRSNPVTLSLRQNILRTNTLAWDRRDQTLRAQQAKRQYLEAMEDVALSALGSFFDAFSAEFDVRNAASNVALNDTLYKISQGRYEVGKIGENELLQSELALIRAQNALDGAKLSRERSLGALRILLRLEPGTQLELVSPSEFPEVSADTTTAVEEALRNRSQIVDLELQNNQANRRVADARRASGMGATLTATAGFNQSGALLDDAYRSLLQQQRFGVSVQMPLWLGGSRSADIGAARSDERRTDISIANTMATIRHEVKFAALEITQSRRQVLSAAKADTVSQLRAESAKNRYMIGKIPINEFYQAQSERDNVLQSYMQSLRGYWTSYYRLRRLTLYDFATGTRLLKD